MQPVWPRYFEACAALVFFVDSSSPREAGGGLIEWFNVLTAAALRGKPMLLVFNKRDRSAAMSKSELRQLFHLTDADEGTHGRGGTALWLSAITGEGTPSLLDWLAKNSGAAGVAAAKTT